MHECKFRPSVKNCIVLVRVFPIIHKVGNAGIFVQLVIKRGCYIDFNANLHLSRRFKIETKVTDNYLIFSIKAIQKGQHCQLCVLRETRLACTSVQGPFVELFRNHGL